MDIKSNLYSQSERYFDNMNDTIMTPYPSIISY